MLINGNINRKISKLTTLSVWKKSNRGKWYKTFWLEGLAVCLVLWLQFFFSFFFSLFRSLSAIYRYWNNGGKTKPISFCIVYVSFFLSLLLLFNFHIVSIWLHYITEVLETNIELNDRERLRKWFISLIKTTFFCCCSWMRTNKLPRQWRVINQNKKTKKISKAGVVQLWAVYIM